jgi:hypothetical protein
VVLASVLMRLQMAPGYTGRTVSTSPHGARDPSQGPGDFSLWTSRQGCASMVGGGIRIGLQHACPYCLGDPSCSFTLLVPSCHPHKETAKGSWVEVFWTWAWNCHWTSYFDQEIERNGPFQPRWLFQSWFKSCLIHRINVQGVTTSWVTRAHNTSHARGSHKWQSLVLTCIGDTQSWGRAHDLPKVLWKNVDTWHESQVSLTSNCICSSLHCGAKSLLRLIFTRHWANGIDPDPIRTKGV